MNDRTPTLVGRHVTLRPLTLDDASELLAVSPPETFRYYLNWPAGPTLGEFREWVQRRLFASDQSPFAVVRNSDGALVGSSSYLDIQPAHKHVEIGCTWYAAAVRGTVINPESKLLMLGHAFEKLGCERVTLKCDGRNEHSQRAIAKLGAVREGVLRKHRIQPDGFVRDTVYFSLIAAEWPKVREGLQARIGGGA
jgi:RimJ/RimL family protein N-acetyltransferase